MKAAWRNDRYSWLDADGIPMVPDNTRLGQASQVADMEELEYCADEECSMVVGGQTHKQHHVDISDLGEFEAAHDHDAACEALHLQKHPCVRRLICDVDQNITRRHQRTKRLTGPGGHQKRARQEAAGGMRKMSGMVVDGYSRKQLMASIVPGAKIVPRAMVNAPMKDEKTKNTDTSINNKLPLKVAARFILHHISVCLL